MIAEKRSKYIPNSERKPDELARLRAARAGYAKKYRASRPGTGRESARQYAKRHPERVKEQARRSHLKTTYGITPEQFDEMVVAQNGCCAICNEKPQGSGRNGRLHIDHMHGTENIRQLLCGLCNRMIGLARERIDILESAIAYLNKHGDV